MGELTKDMIAVPQLWRLSMLVQPHSVDVVLNSLHEDNALIYRHLPLNADLGPAAAFEDFVYENPLLLSDFRKVDVLYSTPRFTIVPSDIDNADVHEAVMHALWPGHDYVVVANKMPRTADTLLMAVDSGVAGFVQRTFLDTRIKHPITSLVGYFAPLSQHGNTGKVYVLLKPEAVTVIGFDGGKLKVANTFLASNADDAAYYVLAAAQQAGFSLTDDEIMLQGAPELREQVAAKLRAMASYVMPVIFPSEIFRSGKEALQAPFELITEQMQ